MRRRCGLLSGLLILMLSSCAGAGQPANNLQEVQSARETWAERGLSSYRFDFERQCFCVREAVEPVTVEVREGAVHEVRSRRTGEVMPHTEAIPWYTIDELLALVEDAQAQGGQEVRVQFHQDGYPLQIEIGSLAADAGVHYTVANVVPLD